MAVPKLRFPGFEDDWNQVKLSEISSIKNGPFGSVLHAEDYVEEGTPIITSEHFRDGAIRKYSSDMPQVSEEDYERLQGYVMREGDILYSRVGLIDTNALVTNDNDGWLFSGRVLRVRPTVQLDSEFLHHALSTEWVIKSIKDRAVGSTMPSINMVILGETSIRMPSYEEQTKIANLLTQIDTVISSCEAELEKTKTYKTGLLQKMFPKEGKDVPEIRFPGFEGKWERKRLGEVLERYEDPVEIPHNGYERIGIRSHAKGVFHSYVEPGKELETGKMHRVEGNKFIVNITFAWEHAVAVTDVSDAGCLVSHRFPQFSFRDTLNPSFFRYIIVDERFRRHLELSSPGGAGRNRVLKIDEMLKYSTCIPVIEEQIAIGTFFQNLDNLISLYQKELDNWKRLKKGLLQQMFV